MEVIDPLYACTSVSHLTRKGKCLQSWIKCIKRAHLGTFPSELEVEQSLKSTLAKRPTPILILSSIILSIDESSVFPPVFLKMAQSHHSLSMCWVTLSPALIFLAILSFASGKLTAKQQDFILQRHNDLRRLVRPVAANMLEMVSLSCLH